MNGGALKTAPVVGVGVGTITKVCEAGGPCPASLWIRPAPPPPLAWLEQPIRPCTGSSLGGPSTFITEAAVIVTVENDWIQISPPDPEPPAPPRTWAPPPTAPFARIVPPAAPEPW